MAPKTLMTLLLLTLLGLSAAPSRGDDLAGSFQHPPNEARPWVYWFWLNGNITREGITADLEAMQRVGIGGALIMEVDQGAPVGPVDFMSPQWRELFKHAISEAKRLGLEINMNDDAGWNGSGGPWIKPEQAMQKIVCSETGVEGPSHFEGALPQPETLSGYYRDIVVLAVPATGAWRIPKIQDKAAYTTANPGAENPDQAPADSIVKRDQIREISASMDGQGRLTWDVPAGKWTILRFGHTCTDAKNEPSPLTGKGLECDKLSPEGIEAQFNGMMAKLVEDNKDAVGKALVTTHIDSWENGSQNWTARMREEFQKRRGYDLLPFLPVVTGRVVDSPEVSARFLWDLRKTVSELVVDNYAGHMCKLAAAHGLRFSCEAYGSPCDNLPYAGMADEPMGEFWTPSGSAIESCRGMASAAHIYGKPVVGAEAFTSADDERWRLHPASVKALGDRAFCEGINRFVFHRYAMQPWTKPDRKPGMTMGPWGLHYERTNTWWEDSAAWHEYLARCQYLLRQGRFAADICYLQAEMPPQSFGTHERAGYDWDECPAEAVLTRMSVKDGRLVVEGGMSYRVLALPDTDIMSPQLLAKIKELVQAGATVIGPRPRRAPGLANYPQCDDTVKALAAELWGDCDGNKIKEHAFGQGRVVWGLEPAKWLAQAGVAPDFTSQRKLRFIHRQADDCDIYFVANPASTGVTSSASFRISGKTPELWWPDTGRIERAPVYHEKDGATSLMLSLEASGSVFVIFRQNAPANDPIVRVTRDGDPLFTTASDPAYKIHVVKARYGVLDNPQQTLDVAARLQNLLDSGINHVAVSSLASPTDPADQKVKTLVAEYTVNEKPFTVSGQDGQTVNFPEQAVQVTVEKAAYGVLDDPKRTIDVRAKLQRLFDAGETEIPVVQMAADGDPAFMVVKTIKFDYTMNGQHKTYTGHDGDVIDLTQPVQAERPAEIHADAAGKVVFSAWQPGEYAFATASGKTQSITVPAPPAVVDLAAQWEVDFDPSWGAPAHIKLDKLVSLSDYPDPGVKYYSGPAVYQIRFPAPAEMPTANRRLFLDLGRVEVMAEVKLNGKSLGLLWKAPFQVDLTDAIRPGENELEIRVVNLWINRMIGDEQLPEDSERNPEGTLKAWPQWLKDGQPSPTGRLTFTSWRLWKKNDPLTPSGLIGPVKLKVRQDFPLETAAKPELAKN